MAENTNKINIDISSTANTAGIEKADDAVKRLNGTVNVSTVDDFLNRTSSKAGVTEAAFYDLDKALGKTANSTATFTAGATKIDPVNRNNAQSLLLFSQGLEDAQFGMRGILNNIPGLIISLGGTAGLAGAISIAAVSFSVLYDWFVKTEEKASDVEERIKTVAEGIGKLESDRLDALFEGIEATADAADALKERFEETKTAENEFSTAALSNAEKLRVAQNNISAALGVQVDRLNELKAIAEEEAAKRKLAADQAIEAERAKLEAARQNATSIADRLAALQTEADVQRANRVQEEARLQALRDRKKELEEIIALEFKLSTARTGAEQFAENEARPAQVAAAKQALADPAFQAELAGQQGKIDAIDAKLNELTASQTGKLARLEVSLGAAENKVADISGAVELNIQRIEETLAADTLVARSQELVKAGEQFATDIKGAFTNFEANNAQQAAAKASLLQAAADGAITADESRQVAEGLRTLIGQLQAGLGAVNSNQQSLIQIMSQFQEQQRVIEGKIQGLSNN